MKKGREPARSLLSPAAKKLRAEIVDEYGIEDSAGLAILDAALQAHDRYQQAQEQITLDGATYVDRFGQPRPHPMLTVERDARAAFLHGLGRLNLDVEPAHGGPGRPAGTANRTRD